jgi:hypothetical protein
MFCQHCRHIYQAMMAGADYNFTLEGGGGSCRQTFTRRTITVLSQEQEAQL